LANEHQHVLLAHRRIVLVRRGDGVESRRHHHDHELVHFLLNLRGSRSRCDRNGGDDTRGSPVAHAADRRPHRGTRREAVVHYDDRASAKVERREPESIACDASLELRTLARRETIDDPRRHAEVPRHGICDDAVISLGHGAESDLFDARHADLSCDDGAKGCAQHIRDFARNRDSAAGEAEHDDAGLSSVGREGLREHSACSGAIAEGRARGHELERAGHHLALVGGVMSVSPSGVYQS
jgi:hypothetical protein